MSVVIIRPQDLSITEDEKNTKKVFIDFRLNLMKGCLRTPFEDQAKRSSIERVNQEIELPVRVRLSSLADGRYGRVFDPARPSAELNWSISADGRAGHVFNLARPSAELVAWPIQLGHRRAELVQLGGWLSWSFGRSSSAICRAGCIDKPHLEGQQNDCVEDPISIAQLSELISSKERWVVVFLTPRQQSLRADQENRIIIDFDETHQSLILVNTGSPINVLSYKPFKTMGYLDSAITLGTTPVISFDETTTHYLGSVPLAMAPDDEIPLYVWSQNDLMKP
uniref:Uncharacterized protein n=1 Tax=Brassica oleracea var. oleracea TaxID=109376 RepID=A0A0D3DKV6_BRAOL